jgi:hypothetical protein
MGIRTWASLAALAVPAALAPSEAGAAMPQSGGQFFGATSQNGVVVAQASGDRRRIAWLDIDVVGRCQGRRLSRPVKQETLYLRGLPLGPDGSFAKSGRITRFDSEPDEVGHYPVVVTGELRGHFPRPGRLTGTARLTLTGRFYLGGSSDEGVFSERATCRTGVIRFSADVPRDTRSRVGALTEVRTPGGCVFSRTRSGCSLRRELGAPGRIVLSDDGRNAYVVSAARNYEEWLLTFRRNPRTGFLRPLEGPQGCLGNRPVAGCTGVRGLRNVNDVVLSPDGHHAYAVGSGGIATFARDTETGSLTQLPGESGCVGAAVDGCAPAPEFADLSVPLELSPDGRQLYVGWVEPGEGTDDGLLWLPRQPLNGTLAATASPGCISMLGHHGCTKAPGGKELVDLVLPGQGRHAYVVLSGGQLASFARDPRNGALAALQQPDTCYFAEHPRDCRPRGGLEPGTIAASRDGRSLYYGFEAGDATVVSVLTRNPTSGRLTQRAVPWTCVGSEEAAGCRPSRGLELVASLAVAPDGRSVYAGSYGDGLAAVFARGSLGGLVQLSGSAGCLVGLHGAPITIYRPYRCKRTLLGDEVNVIAPSRDGRHVYVASGAWPDAGGLHLFARRTR